MENKIKEYKIMLEYSIKATQKRLDEERQYLIESLSNHNYYVGKAGDAEKVSILATKLEVLQDQLDTFKSIFE